MRTITVYATYRWSHERETLVGETTHTISDELPDEAVGEIVGSHLRQLRGAHNELRLDELHLHLSIDPSDEPSDEEPGPGYRYRDYPGQGEEE